jgi:hypothetical protein
MEPEKPIPAHVIKQSDFFAKKARSCRQVYMVMRGSQVILAAAIPVVSLVGIGTRKNMLRPFWAP